MQILRMAFYYMLSLLLLSACQTTPKSVCTPTEQVIPNPDRNAVARGFVEAAYGLGIEPTGCHGAISSNTLQRWNRSAAVNLVVKGEPPDSPLYHYIDRSLLDLYRQAGVTLRLDFIATNQLLQVTVTDEPLPGAVCHTHYQDSSDGLLKTVNVILPRVLLNTSDGGCLLHEGMHSLGFSGHSNNLDSVLNYSSSRSNLTHIDERLIDLLNSYALNRRATPEEALAFAYNQLLDFRE